MAKKKFSKEYLEQADKILHKVMYEKSGAQDWTVFTASESKTFSSQR